MVSAPILAIFNRPPILQKDLISEHPESSIEPSLRGLSPFGAPVSALYVMSREMSETGVEDYVSSRVLRGVQSEDGWPKHALGLRPLLYRPTVIQATVEGRKPMSTPLAPTKVSQPLKCCLKLRT